MFTDVQVTQVQTNVNNLMDFVNHVHDYLQDTINDVFDRLESDTTVDPGEKYSSIINETALYSIGEVEFSGSGVLGNFLGTLFGSLGSLPGSDLSLAFAGVWERFDKDFQVALQILSEIYQDPNSHENDSYTFNGVTVTVASLADPSVVMPSKDDPNFQSATLKVNVSYRYQLTKTHLKDKYSIKQDNEEKPKKTARQGAHTLLSESGQSPTSYAENNVTPPCFINWYPAYQNQGPSNRDATGWIMCFNYLVKGSSKASDDLCNWLFTDDGYGNISNPDGVTPKADVFYNWGLKNSLTIKNVGDDTTNLPKGFKPTKIPLPM